jgi:prolipoprotein diacylglyceryl transferase
MLTRYIPSPPDSSFELGPFTFHFYALCIIAGIAIAIWLGDKRLRAHDPELTSVVADVAIFAVPSGIIGGRIYHVLSSPNDFFGSSGSFLDIFAIWKGGLGIWGAISLGALGAYVGLRRIGRRRPDVTLPHFLVFLDALAPGILFAQAIGRFGNWFNVELFGRPLEAWWALEVPVAKRPSTLKTFETFHPTFLYEAIWCSLIAVILIFLSKKFLPGQVFAIYVTSYCLGRFFIESIRIDSANLFFGLRQNEWVSIATGALALAYFLRIRQKYKRLG